MIVESSASEWKPADEAGGKDFMSSINFQILNTEPYNQYGRLFGVLFTIKGDRKPRILYVQGRIEADAIEAAIETMEMWGKRGEVQPGSLTLKRVLCYGNAVSRISAGTVKEETWFYKGPKLDAKAKEGLASGKVKLTEKTLGKWRKARCK